MKKITKEKFDLIVIGAGTGGVGVARSCAKAGWKVAIVDCPMVVNVCCAAATPKRC